MLSLNKFDEESKVLAYNSQKKIYYSPDESFEEQLKNLNISGVDVDDLKSTKVMDIDIKKGDDLIPTLQHYDDNWSEFRSNHLVISSQGGGKSYFITKLLDQFHDICKKKGIPTRIYLFTFASQQDENLFKPYYEKSEKSEDYLFKYVPIHKLTQVVDSNNKEMFENSQFLFDDAFAISSLPESAFEEIDSDESLSYSKKAKLKKEKLTMIKYILDSTIISVLRQSRKNNQSIIMSAHDIINRDIAMIRKNFDMITFFLNSNKIQTLRYVTTEMGLDKKQITKILDRLKPNRYLRATFYKNYPNYIVSNQKVVLL